jgi:hypothetical protein
MGPKITFGLTSAVALLLASAAFAERPCDCWIDAKTGKPVPTIPEDAVYKTSYTDFRGTHYSLKLGVDSLDPNHAANPETGQNFVRVPCPPPDAAQQAGHTIKKILEHVSIGVGGDVGGYSGGDDRRFHHDDRHVTDNKHSADRLATDHKAHTTDQHASDRKLSDAQKNATTSSDKNRATHHKKPTPTPTPR